MLLIGHSTVAAPDRVRPSQWSARIAIYAPLPGAAKDRRECRRRAAPLAVSTRQACEKRCLSSLETGDKHCTAALGQSPENERSCGFQCVACPYRTPGIRGCVCVYGGGGYGGGGLLLLFPLIAFAVYCCFLWALIRTAL